MRTHNAFERVIVDDVFDFARRQGSVRASLFVARAWALITRPISPFVIPTLSAISSALSGAFEISDFFDGYHDENIYFNSPYQYLPNITDPWKYNHMGIIIGTGEWDNTRHESFACTGS